MIDSQWNPLALRPERFDMLDRPTERTGRHACERGRVARQRRAGEGKHCDDQHDDHDRGGRHDSNRRAASTTPRRDSASVSGLNRHPSKSRARGRRLPEQSAHRPPLRNKSRLGSLFSGHSHDGRTCETVAENRAKLVTVACYIRLRNWPSPILEIGIGDQQ